MVKNGGPSCVTAGYVRSVLRCVVQGMCLGVWDCKACILDAFVARIAASLCQPRLCRRLVTRLCRCRQLAADPTSSQSSIATRLSAHSVKIRPRHIMEAMLSSLGQHTHTVQHTDDMQYVFVGLHSMILKQLVTE